MLLAHDPDTLVGMVKPFGIRLPDETRAALKAHAAQLGLKPGALARDLICRALHQDMPTFDHGWREGFKAGHAEFLRRINQS